jgi:polyisoprenoid-binding protein YceI
MKYAKTKSIIFTALSLAFASPAIAAPENFTIDPNHTNILWHVNHFGFSNPSGRFGITTGTLVLDEKDIKNSKVDVVIDATGLVTGIKKFDDHIKSADFLDTNKFPTATFKSTKVEVVDKKNVKVTGDFTLHGVTKPVVLNVRINKIDIHPMSKKKAAGFSASTTIKRSDFGIDKYIPNVSNEVTIAIESEAVLK